MMSKKGWRQIHVIVSDAMSRSVRNLSDKCKNSLCAKQVMLTLKTAALLSLSTEKIMGFIER